MLKYQHALGATLMFVSVATTLAQIRPSRTWNVDIGRRQSPSGAIASVLGGAEFQRSWGSRYEEQAWQFRLHGVVEPFRFSDSSDAVQWTTSLEFHHEMTANPYNDITFNPRTARWEEYALVHMSTSLWTARAGWLHRCKHDLDNLDGPDEQAQGSIVPVQRTLILSGPTLGLLTAPLSTPLGTVTLSTGAELYVTAADYRRPYSSTTGSWKDMQGAVWIRAADTWRMSATISLNANFWMSVPWFTARNNAPAASLFPNDSRAELYATLLANAAQLDVFVSAEHTFDEISYVDTRSSSYVQLGVRFFPR